MILKQREISPHGRSLKSKEDKGVRPVLDAVANSPVEGTSAVSLSKTQSIIDERAEPE
jgi:hypothetical protein